MQDQPQTQTETPTRTPADSPEPRAAAPATPPAALEAKPEPDPLASLAVDADELARAIRAGQGLDVSRLVASLLDGRRAA